MMQRREAHFAHNVESATKVLSQQILKLVPVETRLGTIEKQMQEQIVVDLFRGEKAHANMLANELMVVRRVYKLVIDLKVIFESLNLRINTIRDYHEFCGVVDSSATGLKEVRNDLEEVAPTAKVVFAELSDALLETVSSYDIGHQPRAVTTEDTLDILEEASTAVEEEIKRKLPTLPEIRPEKVLVNA
jgi:division protein CdvB (Snf7/Vps24/ESCRT-III family)